MTYFTNISNGAPQTLETWPSADEPYGALLESDGRWSTYVYDRGDYFSIDVGCFTYKIPKAAIELASSLPKPPPNWFGDEDEDDEHGAG